MKIEAVRVAVVLVSLTLCTVALAGNRPALDPRLGVVFAADRARQLTTQCSRDVPKAAQGTWLPKASQIEELEERLPQALAVAVANHPTALQMSPNYLHDMDEFGRQYGGLVVAGRKIIYVNAFSRSAMDQSGSDSNSNWRAQPVMVCDGGASFFGVEYDPQSKSFAHFEFNGPG